MIRGWTLALYGTVISAQRDDEPAPRQPSSSSGYNNNNNYSLNTFYRPNAYGTTTNLYTTRKQPSQQKSTTVSVQTGTRKNGKQKNGKGNKNGNKRTSTTPRPFVYTTVMLNQFGSAKNKSKLSQSTSSAGLNRITSTARPRMTTKMTMANTKSYPDSDAKLDGGSKNNNLLSSKTDKLQPANSNIYEKSPGKAPKQVKEGSYTTPSTDTPHQSMSKMFGHYDKIEQIFPELKPYKENNPAYFTVTNGNGKPSRENSKSFSSFVSINSAPQKKNSPSEISTVARQQVLAQATNDNDKNAKGTNQFVFFAITSFSPLFFIYETMLQAWTT